MRNRVPNPTSLYVLDPAWVEQCKQESEHDVRHLGRYLIYEYKCPACGIVPIVYEPDYGYCGPNSNTTCTHCYRMIPLVDTKPIIGEPRPLAFAAMPIRRSA